VTSLRVIGFHHAGRGQQRFGCIGFFMSLSFVETNLKNRKNSNQPQSAQRPQRVKMDNYPVLFFLCELCALCG